jgi:hypothetical protein
MFLLTLAGFRGGDEVGDYGAAVPGVGTDELAGDAGVKAAPFVLGGSESCPDRGTGETHTIYFSQNDTSKLVISVVVDIFMLFTNLEVSLSLCCNYITVSVGVKFRSYPIASLL